MKLALPSMQKTHNKTIFLDKGYKCDYVGNVDIILSPSLYWVQRHTIPIKYDYQIKPLLKALFDETLPSGDFKYSYAKIKDNEYFIYAYSEDEIKKSIVDAGIELKSVGSIYFAQNELSEYFSTQLQDDEALCVDGEFCIVKSEDTIIKVPAIMAVSKFEIANILDQIELSKQRIKLNSFTGVIDSGILYRASLFFVILSFGVLIEYAYNNSQIQKIQQQKSTLASKNNLPSTQIQLNSIIKKQTKNDIKQTKIRDILYKISSLRLDSSKIKNIQVDRGSLSVVLSNKSDATILKKEFINSSISSQEDNTLVRIRL